MTHLPIWYLGKVPSQICDAACSELELIEPKDASMGIDGADVKHDHRNTTVRFAEDGFWFAGILLEHAMKANRECKWEYDITFHECLQYAEYGPEQHYKWHTDTFALSGAPTDRKVTAVCLMSDVTEFEGGQFQMRLYNEYDAPLEKGTIIAFPSILEHRVTPVISGLRKSATIWLNGPRFK
jgi:PKHD-type hydroxylase